MGGGKAFSAQAAREEKGSKEEMDEQEISEALEEVDAGDVETESEQDALQVSGDVHAERLAFEECLHSIATLAIELDEGKRQSITAQDIQIVFKNHDVFELYEEAQIFNSAAEGLDELEDLEGEDGPEDEDSEEEE